MVALHRDPVQLICACYTADLSLQHHVRNHVIGGATWQLLFQGHE